MANTVKDVSLSVIGVDLLQLFRSVDDHILPLVEHLKNGGTVPPIHVEAYKPFFKLLDGHHRYVAHKLLGKENISVYYEDTGEAKK